MPKIDVEALWEQSGHWLTDYTAAVIEECAKCVEERGSTPSYHAVDPVRTAAAIRALKP